MNFFFNEPPSTSIKSKGNEKDMRNLSITLLCSLLSVEKTYRREDTFRTKLKLKLAASPRQRVEELNQLSLRGIEATCSEYDAL